MDRERVPKPAGGLQQTVAVLVVLLIAVGAVALVRRGRDDQRWWDVG
jgi:hypothetical protein